MKSFLNSVAVIVVAGMSVSAQPGIAQQAAGSSSNIMNDAKVRQLSDQNVDANQKLLDALRRAAKRGPIFRISPTSVSLSLDANETRTSTIRITNSGDDVGRIEGINLIGSVPDMSMDTTCGNTLKQGDFCEISITYVSHDKADYSVRTAIVGTINERDRSEFQIPIVVTVKAPPPPPEQPPAEPNPTLKTKDTAHEAPKPDDIAKRYMGAVGVWSNGFGARRGFDIVSARTPVTPGDVSGVRRYDRVRTRTVQTDQRYSKDIPYTNASLPVNRDRILTADRVIKAVLETPISNIMCNQVVAMVESDVYSATSDVPLIQAGSRVIGECQKFVDERVGVAWHRIITTDGRSISFKDKIADTSDATALGGALGRVYMSPFDKYVLPIFSTMIDTAAGVIYATFGKNENVTVDQNGNVLQGKNAKNEGLRIITDQARGTAQKFIKDIQDTRKVVVVPKGSRIDINFNEDIYFKEDRQVVMLDDMRFNLKEALPGQAERDLPSDVVLTPVNAGYDGKTVQVDGRLYKIKDSSSSGSGAGSPDVTGPDVKNPETTSTINDLRGSGQGIKSTASSADQG